MSRIKAFRLINLNYNNNTIHVDDEIFHLNQESTLLSLRNGGGKSVLVQVLIALFVNRRYRDTAERAFDSYFTTNKPTFILVEWALDGGAGYVLTGMVVRRKQEVSDDDSGDTLDMLNFVCGYQESNPYDLVHFPFVEQINREKRVKSFQSTRALFEDLRKERQVDFNYYDMGNSHQARNYFDKLAEYRINHTEWEKIIKKVNMKESGLSELFTNAKNVGGLVEKWFLPAVEDKLSQDENKIKNFVGIVQKYILQYQANKGKLDRRQTIALFEQEMQPIIDQAEGLQGTVVEGKKLENQLACLREALLEQLQALQEAQGLSGMTLDRLARAIGELLYEQKSLEIYGQMDQTALLAQRLSQGGAAVRAEQSHQGQVTRDWQLQICAKLLAEYTEVSREQQQYERRLEACLRKNEDSAPRRKALGYTLRQYYEHARDEKLAFLQTLEAQLRQDEGQLRETQVQLQKVQQAELAATKAMGRVEARVQSYDAVEREFNQHYGEKLQRNVLGYYEEGLLTEQEQHCAQEAEALAKRINGLENERVQLNQALSSQRKHCEELVIARNSMESQRQQQAELAERLTAELSKRRDILRYLNLDETHLFDRAGIELRFKACMLPLSEAITTLQITENTLREAYEKLATGKVLELPKAFEEALADLGIAYVYGMDWLRNNQKSPAENAVLVAQNPFIPYGLILQGKDLAKLQAQQLDFFTASPIPLIIREKLDAAVSGQHEQTVTFGQVSFFVAFNHGLLDEDGLKRLLAQKQQKIDRVVAQIAQKHEELAIYRGREAQIAQQSVTKGDYEALQQAQEDGRSALETLENTLYQLRLTMEQEQEHLNQIASDIAASMGQRVHQQHRQEALATLTAAYGHYQDERRAYEQGQQMIAAQQEAINVAQQTIKDLQERSSRGEKSRQENTYGLKEIQRKCQIYQSYEEGELIVRDIDYLEAEYQSLLETMTAEESLIRDSLASAQKNFASREAELLARSKDYGLITTDYAQVAYDEFLEKNLKAEMVRSDQQLMTLKKAVQELDKQLAVGQNQVDNGRREMAQTLGRSELKPREQIVVVDFGAALAQKRQQKKAEEAHLDQLRQDQGRYESNLSALSEFENLSVTESVDVLLDLASLDSFRGGLVRDLNQSKALALRKQGELDKALDRVLRIAVFQEDYFHKPLEMFLTMTAQPESLLETVEKILDAYHTWVEKLAADIALIEGEKEAVMAQMFVYVAQIHGELGKIDKNATISIRGRAIKMLKIILEDWDTRAGIYQQRLEAWLERVTAGALEKLRHNEPIEEYIGHEVTTKALYDQVVSINSVDIKLYKIEAEKEYLIGWDEVAKNSGGEGFLSAFVILSSLMSYMRREDTDVFMEQEDGKVLIMDNPFAQTNAAHLLKPLMDIAKKNNTQLICFSGLGGESIYNRFNNIYVLNLVSAQLRQGLYYVKAEQRKGETSVENVVTAQVKLEEMRQLELF